MHRFQRWRDAIQSARDPAAVSKVMREYVDSLPPTVISVLPPDSRRALGDPDIQRAAVSILHCELAFKGDAEVADLLHEVAHTFAAASLRLARLSGDPLRGTVLTDP